MEERHASWEPPAKMRIGKFRIATGLIWSDPESVLKALSGVIVLEARTAQHDCIEYIGLHDLFEEIPAGREVPFYDILMFRKGSGEVHRLKFERRAA